MNNLISIVIPVKNGAQFLRECLDSIINQSITNWELIIVDDHSTDNTSKILQEYCNTHLNIHQYKNSGTGIIEALKLAYSKTKGSFITRMDADDIMLPNKLEVLYTNLIKKGKGHLATGLVKYFSEDELGNGFIAYQDWLNELTLTGNNYSEIYKECVIPSPSWMLYREDFDLCGGFNCDVYPEDYDLCFRFYKQGLKVIPCNQTIHKWRDYSTRTSRTDDNYSHNTFIPLKCNYFIQLDYNSEKKLVLWGTGKKGKSIAKHLIEHNIPFTWVTNNPKKIGHDVYGVIIESTDKLPLDNNQYIIAVANKEEQKEILALLAGEKEVFFFC